ncbi:hypothetical protein ACFWWC_23435 [Streptomyces sp. NPDC058642]|uniref:hypothetical protein n=1 Tax=Streptomyces sp. NPDC058642 TaxID=3346572 RepID=UPI00365DF528
MASSELPTEDLPQILRVVKNWCGEWGEEAPHHVIAVSTTHCKAMQKIYGPQVSADDIAIYLVVARGYFSYLAGVGSEGTVRSGTWAALFIEQETLAVRGFTVRFPGEIPKVNLADLGPVRVLRP